MVSAWSAYTSPTYDHFEFQVAEYLVKSTISFPCYICHGHVVFIVDCIGQVHTRNKRKRRDWQSQRIGYRQIARLL